VRTVGAIDASGAGVSSVGVGVVGVTDSVTISAGALVSTTGVTVGTGDDCSIQLVRSDIDERSTSGATICFFIEKSEEIKIR
jgi:hypothetical protein